MSIKIIRYTKLFFYTHLLTMSTAIMRHIMEDSKKIIKEMNLEIIAEETK